MQSGSPSPVHSRSPKKKSNTKTLRQNMANAHMFKSKRLEQKEYRPVYIKQIAF